MDFLKPITPQYQGSPVQPKASGGLLSQLLCYLFGGGTPAYQGSGQPVSKACGVPGFPVTPAYKAPVVETSEPTGASVAMPVPDDGVGEVAVEPVQATGPITIVVR